MDNFIGRFGYGAKVFQTASGQHLVIGYDMFSVEQAV